MAGLGRDRMRLKKVGSSLDGCGRSSTRETVALRVASSMDGLVNGRGNRVGGLVRLVGGWDGGCAGTRGVQSS